MLCNLYIDFNRDLCCLRNLLRLPFDILPHVVLSLMIVLIPQGPISLDDVSSGCPAFFLKVMLGVDTTSCGMEFQVLISLTEKKCFLMSVVGEGP